MNDKANLYFVEGGLSIGLSVLHLTDLCMALSFSRALLDCPLKRENVEAEILLEGPLLWDIDSESHAHPSMTSLLSPRNES